MNVLFLIPTDKYLLQVAACYQVSFTISVQYFICKYIIGVLTKLLVK